MRRRAANADAGPTGFSARIHALLIVFAYCARANSDTLSGALVRELSRMAAQWRGAASTGGESTLFGCRKR